MILLPAVLASCIEDKSSYDYIETNQVTFLDESFSVTAGETVNLTAPVSFSKPTEDVDAEFDIVWYLDLKEIARGYRITYDFPRSGGFTLHLKITNRTTGEVFLSDAYPVTAKSSFGWGWMVLTDRGDGESGLSFISPVSLFVSHGLENDIEGGLGSDPRNLFYYNIFGTVANNAILGVPKVLVNQGSGSVTLDGSTLQKDMWLRDEFGGAEPVDLHIESFGWNRPFYAICTAEGDLYIRDIDSYENKSNAYYGRYSTLPLEFEGGARIGCFQSFPNPLYTSANADGAMAYDELNGRFVALTEGNASNRYNAGVEYLQYYDSEYVRPAGVRAVNAMGAGSRCLGLSAFQYTGASTEGTMLRWSEYVALMELDGAGDYCLYTFTVNPLSFGNHVVTESTQTPFAWGSLLDESSVVAMSSNFDEHPFFYFTDGAEKLYVCSVVKDSASGSVSLDCKLAYTAAAPITHICASPIRCYFQGWGANSTEPNFRLALSQTDGDVSIVDVSYPSLVRLFAGTDVDLEIAVLHGFGDVKGMVWCTNIESEY